jgi:hypothetical protein
LRVGVSHEEPALGACHLSIGKIEGSIDDLGSDVLADVGADPLEAGQIRRSRVRARAATQKPPGSRPNASQQQHEPNNGI